jgi:hypothetical protein
MSNLRSKLAAIDAELTSKDAAAADTVKRHDTIVLREFGRLCVELGERVRKLLGGEPSIEIASRQHKITLQYEGTRPPRVVGEISAPSTIVKFRDRVVEFRPEGIGYIGAYGKIAIVTNARVPDDDGIFMKQSPTDPEQWILAVSGQQFRRSVFDELTDERLEKLLEKALTR